MGLGGSQEEHEKPLMASKEVMDIKKFMGRWFVISCIPIPYVEEGALNSVEEYELKDEEEGIIEVTFRYQKKSFDNAVSTATQKAVIYNRDTGILCFHEFIVVLVDGLSLSIF